MLTVTLEFIQGVSLGFEIVDHKDIDDGEGWFLVVDLFIVRILFDLER